MKGDFKIMCKKKIYKIFMSLLFNTLIFSSVIGLKAYGQNLETEFNDILNEYKNENIKYLLAQPGARSLELEQYCIENNILYLEDCALVQLKNL